MRTKLIILAVAVVLVVAVYFLFFRKKSPAVSTAKVGAHTVSGSPSNSITNLAISGIKALTGTPTAVKSDITFTDEEGAEDMAAATDTDSITDST